MSQQRGFLRTSSGSVSTSVDNVYVEINHPLFKPSWYPEVESKYKLLAAFYIFAFLYDLTIFFILIPVSAPEGPRFRNDSSKHYWGWHLIYLTNWAGILQTVYLFTCILDLFARSSSSSSLHRFRSRLFTLEWPIAVFVFIGYFAALFPSDVTQLDAYNIWLTLSCHGMTTVFIAVEMFVVPHEFAETRWAQLLEVLTCMMFAVVYLCWNFLTHYLNDGEWTYPVQADLPMWFRPIAYIGAVIFVMINYVTGRWINRKYWKIETDATTA